MSTAVLSATAASSDAVNARDVGLWSLTHEHRVAVGVAVGVLRTSHARAHRLLRWWSRSIPRRSRPCSARASRALGAKKTGESAEASAAGTDVHYEFGGGRKGDGQRRVREPQLRERPRCASTPGHCRTRCSSPKAVVDRFGKVIGLNREVQTGDQAFDDACYVDTSEDDAVVKRLLESP